MIKNFLKAGAVAASLLFAGTTAQAGIVIGADSVTASSSWDSSFGPGNAIDQSGLSSNYVSGVTDFATYFAGNPTHNPVAGNEWFATNGELTSWLVFDLGSAFNLSDIAIWNEESWGGTTVDISFSLDNILFGDALIGLSLTDNPVANYGADLFSFSTVVARYVRLDLQNCNGNACSLGEVAFGTTNATNVSEPGALALLGLGLLGAAFYRRRRIS